MRAIFDIGAFNGLDGLLLSIFNKKTKVYAFEPNPFLMEKIKKNKKTLEKKLKFKINNYELIPKIVSDKNGKLNFFITKNYATSSILEPKKKLDGYWVKNSEKSIRDIANFLKIKKKILAQSLRLDNFCHSRGINQILYIHCDTQGNDLKVLNGLGRYRKKVYKGVIEIAPNKKLSLYKNSGNIIELKKKFKTWKYKILKIKEFHKKNPERDVYFINENFKRTITLNLPTEKQKRVINRLLVKKLRFKDFLYINFIKMFKI